MVGFYSDIVGVRLISMPTKIVRNFQLLFGGALIFLLGTFYGSSLNGGSERSCTFHSHSSAMQSKSGERTKPIDEQTLRSFSFAYNITHLWSIRLPDANYYRMTRLLPCRSVDYTGGPKIEPLNTCDQSTFKQFSVESAVRAQKWIYEHQHPADCTNKKFAVIHQYAWSGFGSTVHQILWAFGVALGEDRIAVYETPGNWLYGNCPSSTPDCLFLPISNCSVPSVIDGKQTIRITADFGHWIRPILPPIFRNQSFNWYRSQLVFYLMRYNPETLAHVQHAISQYFQPLSLDSHRPYSAVYIRRSDKITGREMTQAYSLQQYFDLFDKDARQIKINTVYINSEDEKAFTEFDPVNKNKGGYYQLLSINVTRNVIFASMLNMPPEQRKKVVLEFLTDLFIEVNADLHAGTLTSNWCRLVDEIKLAVGKIMPYYTPENRFIIDV